jgi:hypothetical protein
MVAETTAAISAADDARTRTAAKRSKRFGTEFAKTSALCVVGGRPRAKRATLQYLVSSKTTHRGEKHYESLRATGKVDVGGHTSAGKRGILAQTAGRSPGRLFFGAVLI